MMKANMDILIVRSPVTEVTKHMKSIEGMKCANGYIADKHTVTGVNTDIIMVTALTASIVLTDIIIVATGMEDTRVMQHMRPVNAMKCMSDMKPWRRVNGMSIWSIMVISGTVSIMHGRTNTLFGCGDVQGITASRRNTLSKREVYDGNYSGTKNFK